MNCIIKKALSASLCAAMVLSFAACGEEKSKAEETASSIRGASEIPEKSPENITDREIYTANSVSYLLSVYNSIRITCEYDGLSVIKYIFNKNGKPVFIEDNRQSEETREVRFWYNGFNFSLEGDRVKVNFSLEELPDTNSDFPFEYMISDNVTGEVVEYIGESDGCYEFSVTGRDEEIHYAENHFFDKKTGAVKKTICSYDGKELSRTYFDYDTPVAYASVLDGWDGKLKEVTVIAVMAEDYAESVVTKKYSIPADWEMLPYSYEEAEVYLDEGMTKPYRYPGDGVDYTIYVTNIMG